MTRLVRVLLWLYPASFRERYGCELLGVVELDRLGSRHRGVIGNVRVASYLIADVLMTALRLRGRQLRQAFVQRGGRGRPRQPLPAQRTEMDTLIQDVRYALRQSIRRPAFTAIAVLSLALAIGGNSLIYGLLDGFVFHPFPYPDPDRLVSVGVTFPKLSSETNYVEALSPAEYLDMRESRSFSHTGSFDLGNRNISGGDVPERVFTGLLLDDLFPVIGMTPLLGRGFTREELSPNGPPAAIISHRLWQSRFGGDPNILNRAIRISGRAASVVGVMPPGLVLIGTDLWIPWGGDPTSMPRNVRQFNVLARLAPGASLTQANAELAAIARRVEQSEKAKFAEYDNWQLTATPWAAALLKDVRPAAFLLLGAVGLVLLIACANLTNLFLARSTSRQRELAVRLALGAARWRIVRHLLTESALLALAGAAIGVVIAWAGLKGADALIPAQFRMLGLEAGINMRVLLWSLGLALAAGLLVGVLPAFQATRTDPHESLKADSRTGGSRGGRHLRSVLVVAEIALSVMLLLGAGLLDAQLPEHPADRSWLRRAGRVDDAADSAARTVSGRCGWRILRSVVGTPGRIARRACGLRRVAVSADKLSRYAVPARAWPDRDADIADGPRDRRDAKLFRNTARAVARRADLQSDGSPRHAAGRHDQSGVREPVFRDDRSRGPASVDWKPRSETALDHDRRCGG